MIKTDTITALATPPGRGSIGILRVSGNLSAAVAKAILGTLPHSRQATYLPFYEEDGTTLDQGIALFFQRPNSFTGEDVLELQGHGGPIILDLLLKRILSLPGIRLARPGEFSERAFLNNRLDLSQAEAIADLIDANSAQAARSAVNSLQGAFSKRIYRLLEDITNLRIYIEAAIDFPDEDINPLSTNIIENKLNNIITSLEQVRTEASQGNLLREGMKVVITGKPNAGKSSLLNALLGWNAAIVTAISGTTRDVLREQINIDGMPLNIIDTAGIHNTNNEIEIIGIKRAWCEINNADHVLLIVDGTVNNNNIVSVFKERLPQNIPVTIVRNKADLTGEIVGLSEASGHSLITLSAKYGAGIDVLRKHLKHQMGFTGNTEGSFLARRRHLEALKKVAVHLSKSKEQLISNANDEILAEELRLAQQFLSEITGEFTSNDLLSRIFSSFCIGK